MSEWMHLMLDWVTAYYGDKVYFFLAIAAYVYLFISTKDIRKKVLYPCVLILFLVLNPYLYACVYSRIIYWRLFWMLPNGIAIAYAAVLFIEKRKHNITKIVWIVAFALCIILKGTNVYTHSGMVQAENEQNVFPVVKNVCDYILAESENPRCIMPREWYSQVRQYSGDIEMMYGRNADGYINTIDDMSKRIADELTKETPDFAYVFGQAFIQKYDFVVVQASKFVDDAILQQYGYVLQTTIDGYNIFYHDNIEKREIGGWVVTQYGPNGGLSTCYTIEDENGNLIIIDGGYWWNADKLRALIRQHDNHVTAWIVTSARNEHSGAFCTIAEDLQGIQIDTIYTELISDEQFQQYKEKVDIHEDAETVECCIEIIRNMNQVIFVSENDEFDILGLHFKVLHTWNEETNSLDDWHILDGSMAITIEGKQQKMLFCSDLTSRSEYALIERHVNDLDADIVQMNNHGISSFSGQMYDLISPETAFFDCQSTEFAPDAAAAYSYSYVIGNQIELYGYETVPNWIILR